MGINIQWFPGHMAKALRQFEENISLIDIILELVDARCPYSSINPEVQRIGVDKPHLLILTKADLADPKETNRWMNYFQKKGYAAIAVDSKSQITSKKITKIIQNVLRDKLSQKKDKGMVNQSIKAVCVGVPNVGKSTLLNRLVKHRAAQVGNKPGVTKGQQWLRSNQQLELLDTPGILWPKFQTQAIADKLALTGAIKENLYPSDDVALFALDEFKEISPDSLIKRYRLNPDDLELSNVDLLMKITKNVGKRDDFEQGSDRIIMDIRKNKLGRFTLDSVRSLGSNDES